MNKNTTNFIKELTTQDKKTLSQKCLKVSEEVGELAKLVLPYDDASGTKHRFVDKNKILEEVADVYLTAVSIAYKLDFSDDDFEEMVLLKAKKWSDLQKAEARIKDTLPYEIHVTVEQEGINKEFFVRDCNNLNVKPIMLDLQKTNTIIKDVMTSSVYVGNNRGAYDEMKRISNGLISYGYNVIREKIETVPWHPAAPSEESNNFKMPDNCYFETHIGVLLNNQKELEKLKNISNMFNAHLSKNTFKKHTDGSFTQMVTLRLYHGTFEDFDYDAMQLEESIKEFFEIEKRITEFSIFDTKVSHDSKWLSGEK